MGIFSRAVMAFIVMLGLPVTLSMGQTSAPKAAKATASKSSIVIIRGTLMKEDKTPLASKGPFEMVFLTAAPTEKEGEGKTSYTLTNEGLNKNTAQPDARGRFAIRLDRSTIPKGKKVVILMWGAGGSGMEPLRINGQPVAFDLDEKSTSVSLGIITVKKE
jgi:hypothetical protein